jgi:phenylacetate-coenzyme A ligase PaaK-like adenylate-forming protein
MTSDLSIFAAQLRDIIVFQSEDPDFASPSNPAMVEYLDVQFNGYAMVLFALQFNNNAAYRQLCSARGITPDNVNHWSEIPAAPALGFKELELTSLPPEQRTTVFHSSGTTEQKPSRHFHNAESLELYETSLWPWFVRHLMSGLSPSSDAIQLVILTPSPMHAPNSSLVHMFETVRRKLGAHVDAYLGELAGDKSWQIPSEKVVAYLESACQKQQPVMLVGTAFLFVHVLDELSKSQKKFQLPVGSRVLETGGYKGRSRSLSKTDLHTLITELLGVPHSHIVSEYGMSELSSQAYDLAVDPSRIMHPASRIFHFPPWARARVVSPETGREVADGETGLIRIFDLANVFSVMAVQTEDLGIRRGNDFELIGRAEKNEARGCSLMSA